MTKPDYEPSALLAGGRLLDLTHPMKVGDPIFPGQPGFTFETLGTLENAALPLYYGCVSFMEHCGTHMDAPAHVVSGQPFLHELGPDQLIGPAVKLDLRARCADDADFDVSAQDIDDFEGRFGRITPGSIVCLHTGWDVRYPAADRYIVDSADGEFHWPGVSRAAAELLADRRIRGVAIDTIGLDGGHVALTLAAHRAILQTGAFIIENVANLSDLAPIGATLIALPMKVHNGSGAPTRVLAVQK